MSAYRGGIRQNKEQKKLGILQKLACLIITGAMKTTPSAAMETLLNLPSL